MNIRADSPLHRFAVDTVRCLRYQHVCAAKASSSGNLCRSGQAREVRLWCCNASRDEAGERGLSSGVVARWRRPARGGAARVRSNITQGDGFGTVWTGVEPSP